MDTVFNENDNNEDQAQFKPVHPIHPLFAEDADVILGAKEGQMFFKVHSFSLKTASGFFRSMFTLPQQGNKPATTIYLDEDADTLECLLRMICGLPLNIESWEEGDAAWDRVESLLDAIEKYDLPGPLSIMRLLIMTPPMLLNQPFRLYAVASRFGWEHETKFASKQTLSHNLYDPEIRKYLRRISTDALLKLFDLHRARREGLRERLNNPPFVPGSSATCATCRTLIDYHTWRELKYKIILEMDLRPLGDTVTEVGLNEWNEALACWTAQCPTSQCARSLYDKGETVRVIKECIEGLPSTI
ncbi:hypothetical protein C8J56DRAFT_1044370 [Mycena floridula]|nr:hypothetical protein C8J56DRAFT_1044370 [Mycena floridula]